MLAGSNFKIACVGAGLWTFSVQGNDFLAPSLSVFDKYFLSWSIVLPGIIMYRKKPDEAQGGLKLSEITHTDR